MLLVTILAGCDGPPPVDLDGSLGLCDACEASCVEEALLAGSRVHVEGGVDYTDVPPTSGDHDPCWAPWGVHETEVPDERWVHNLEHGGVVLLYNCPDGCDAEVDALAAMVEERGAFGLLTPYAALPARFAAVSWGHRYVTDCFDPEALEAFWDARANRAPESLTSDPSPSCP